MEGNKSSTFTRRSVETTGQVPVPREEGLAISVGDNIYYYAGRAKGNICLDEVTGSVLHVFNTKSASWTKIETSPPRARCGDIFIYGTAIGTDIWIYDSGTWLCFDTVKQQWRKVDQLNTKKESYSSLHLSSIGVIGQSLYYYDGNLNSFEKKVYQVNTSTSQISTSDEEGFGEHPQERHDTFVLAVSDDILVIYAPFASYEKKQAEKRGELFYYDLNEAKWARVKQLKDEPALNLHAYYYVGRIGSALYFSPTRDTDPNQWWTLDLATSTWEKKIITGDKPKLFANYVTVVGDKIYCWMEDGTMTVVDIHNMPSSDQRQQIDEQLAQMARAALSQIKRPGTVIDEYIPEPIIIDTDLDPAQPNSPEIHREIAKDFSSIFPLIEEQKIIETTVAARFEPGQVYMHKNYLHYLTLAWANHFSVILSPDIIFYTVLCEIADEILTDPDAFRHLFTNSTEKKGIMSFVHDETKIDVNQLIEGISKNLPVDASIFTADFSCSTPESRLAMQSAFCEAMSAYYYYMSTMCGIPRVKVLGTKQDWETLEHKLHRMRTEVFNQDGSASQKMSLYIKAAEEQTRKIYTTRDPAFWKDMFAINTCMSGHTDVVEGWINAFYRKGYATKESGVVKFYGDDFYNYKAHISTVKWQNVESQRNFELKSGLLYSNVVSDESPEDKKHPWLEPQFCHVIIETDGGKMPPEAFKKFIETTLKGRDKQLMLQFFDVLKDDPIEFVKDRGVKEVNFKLELVRRLIEHWKQEYLKNGQGSSVFNLSAEPCSSALDFFSKIGKSNQDAFDALKEKIIEYLKINTNITQVHNSSKLSKMEHEIVDVFIGNPKIEELTVYLTTQESVEKVSQFLLHPSCNLKTLTIGRVDNYYSRDEDDDKEVSPDYSVFAAALLKTKAPLDKLSFDSINDTDIATSVAELCRRPNGLKHLNVVSLGSRSSDITEILIRGQVESKTLHEISLSGVDRKEVVVEGRKRWVDAETDELKECVVKNMPLNPSLEHIGYIRFKLNPVELSKALSIPSLKSIKFTDLQDLSFLDATTKLESINCTLNCLSEQMTYLQKFVVREDCPLKILSVEKSTLYHGAAAVLGKGLVHNKSILEFNIRKSSIKDEDDVSALVESILEWLEKPYCKLKKLNLSEMPLKFEGANLQRLLNVLKTNKTLKQIDANVTFTMEHLPLFRDLVQNSPLNSANFGGTSATKLAGEELSQFVTATLANENLVSFRAPFLDYEGYKYPRSLWNDEDFYE